MNPFLLPRNVKGSSVFSQGSTTAVKLRGNVFRTSGPPGFPENYRPAVLAGVFYSNKKYPCLAALGGKSRPCGPDVNRQSAMAGGWLLGKWKSVVSLPWRGHLQQL
jgi:hypothetical protein